MNGSFILIGSFLALLIFKFPITFSLFLSSIITATYLNIPLMSIVQRLVSGVHSFSLLAIPFFILSGEIMSQGGISRRLVHFSNALVGQIRGGLAQVNIIASMLFGGISGSAVADVSSIGAMLIPMMVKDGYDADFSVAVTVTSSLESLIIPPSHNLIIFAMAAGGGVSVGKLFLGGIVPGIGLGLLLMIPTAIISVKRNYPKMERMAFKEIIKVAVDAFFGLMTIIIIIGGVISGIFTATESAAVATVYAFIVTFFVYREIPIRQMSSILNNVLRTLAMVMSLIAAASSFGYLMAYLRIPQMVTNALLTVTTNRVALLLLINLMLLILGTIMDMAPLIIITTPILYPVVVGYLGMDPVQFGIMLILNLAIGLTTPPVGSALFVGCSIGKVSIEQATKAIVPFYLVMVIALLFVTFVPGITLFLPSLLS
ncbi:MAG: TRAP transporter large permease [Spirochaetales bacterium]|jgi:tripartite ATP-independent transporter DctM subunit|nr:TRAP transporter large permease [Spirochaetota bacterium]NLL25413.1 TRAP transporter large permease [Spirochaetales bacterium]HPY46084.1 TRAP transporter large permease [Sphaerochaeta sp.]HQB06065.1 TRAP transporter large permease [Sphaerochaeta sp.]